MNCRVDPASDINQCVTKIELLWPFCHSWPLVLLQ